MGELRFPAVILTVAVGIIALVGLGVGVLEHTAIPSTGVDDSERGERGSDRGSGDPDELAEALTGCDDAPRLAAFCEVVETIAAEHLATIGRARLVRAATTAVDDGVRAGEDARDLELRAIAAVLEATGDEHARYRVAGEEPVSAAPDAASSEEVRPVVGGHPAPPVVGRLLDRRTGYLRPSTFADAAPERFRRQLGQQLALGVDGVVLDLRGNRGGLVRVAREIADELLPAGVAFTLEGRDGRRSYATRPGGLAEGVALVVLVDERTASAAEMLAVALSHHRGVATVGATTAGKATVQASFPLETGGTLRLTTARWLTPDGRSVDGAGLVPDVEVIDPGTDGEIGEDDPVMAEARAILERQR